jgi:hypothetical protein
MMQILEKTLEPVISPIINEDFPQNATDPLQEPHTSFAPQHLRFSEHIYNSHWSIGETPPHLLFFILRGPN